MTRIGEVSEFPVSGLDGPLVCSLRLPASADRAPAPGLLLTFATTRQAALGDPPQDIPARLALAAGHGVVSFDLPNHGMRVDEHGEGIDGLCRAFLAGDDPFARFVADGVAVIDACRERGLGAGGVVVCGVSRAGYCALRLAAADARVRAVAGLAPVIDWRSLTEFAAVRGEGRIAALALERWAPELAGRNIFLAIGNRDERVGTDCCVGFAQALLGRDTSAGGLEMHVVDCPGHTLSEGWRAAGAHFLLERLV